MLGRTSCVDTINVKIVSYSSVLQLGDSIIINGMSRALAVQREAEIFYGNEGNFSDYPLFSESIIHLPITEPLYPISHHVNPLIKVNHIDIIGISVSSMLHVGNSQHVAMETRIKHIRQLLPLSEEEAQ